MQEGTKISLGYPGETTKQLVGTVDLRGNVFAAQCPTRLLLDRIADKWTVLLLATLSDGPARFNALKRRIDGVSQKMLAHTLRQMERDGLVTRTVEATVPVTVTYEITEMGLTLVEALKSIIDWAELNMPAVERAQQRYDSNL